jgi:hypothetical protein
MLAKETATRAATRVDRTFFILIPPVNFVSTKVTAHGVPKYKPL